MTREDVKSILNEAIAKYGEESQTRMAIEEMAELTDAIMKRYRGRNSKYDVITEIADVCITVMQLAFMYDVDLVYAEIIRKLERLAERMNYV